MTADKIAPLAVFLASDLAKDVTGQIFAVRNLIALLPSLRLRHFEQTEGYSPAVS